MLEFLLSYRIIDLNKFMLKFLFILILKILSISIEIFQSSLLTLQNQQISKQFGQKCLFLLAYHLCLHQCSPGNEQMYTKILQILIKCLLSSRNVFLFLWKGECRIFLMTFDKKVGQFKMKKKCEKSYIKTLQMDAIFLIVQ